MEHNMTVHYCIMAKTILGPPPGWVELGSETNIDLLMEKLNAWNPALEFYAVWTVIPGEGDSYD